MAIHLTHEQQTAVTNTGGSLLVSAAAGSGKTKVLVERVLRLVMEGWDVDRLLIITFTKAAAAELRGRILEALKQKQLEQPDNPHLQRQTTLIYRAQISTIHSFCQTVLKEEGYRIELDSDFRIADESAIHILKNQVLESVLESCYDRVEKGDSFSHLLDTMSVGKDDKKLVNMVLDIHSKVQSHPDPDLWLEQQCQLFGLEGCDSIDNTPWAKEILSDSRTKTTYWKNRMRDLWIRVRENGTLPIHEDVLSNLVQDLDDFERALTLGWDAACEAANINYGRLATARKGADKELAAKVSDLKGRCKNRMDKVTDRFCRSGQLMLEDMQVAAPAVIALLQLVREFDVAFSAEKRRRKIADYSDLEHLALKLLVNKDDTPTPAALRYQYQFAEVMVDEYQDTNQVQNKLFRTITDNGRKLFMVGDVKQSIYRFRLADPGIFLQHMEDFPYYTQAEVGKPRKVILSKNFRSRKSVLNATNFIFRAVMSPEFGDMAYSGDHSLNWGLEYPDYSLDHPELDILDVAGIVPPEDGSRISKSQVEADFIARRIRRLMEEGYQVTQGDGFRPMEWSDIVILHRSPNSVVNDLTKALDACQIPWQTEGKSDFFGTTEIAVAMSYLKIIDNPHQDIPLISVLRSPLFGFTPDLLASIRTQCPKGDFYTAVEASAEQGNQACVDFLEQLGELRFMSADRTASSLIWEMYERSAMLPIFTAQPGGEIRRSNLILLYEHARQFEQNGSRGLFDFLTQIRRMIENGKQIEVSGIQGSGVKIMSVHKSKGLEFPVVVLCGLFHKFNTQDETAPILFHPTLGVGPNGLDPEKRVQFSTLARSAVRLKLHQEMCAEELRLLYVAMTRAREKLIMVGTVGEFGSAQKQSGKKTPTDPMKRLAEEASYPMNPQVLSDMNCMGEWIVSAAMTRTEGICLCRGQQPLNSYQPEKDKEETPWDIFLIDAQMPERGTRSDERIKTAQQERELPPLDGLRWKYAYQGLSEIPSKLTATQLKGRNLDQEIEEDTIRHRPVSFRRPDFTQQEKELTPAEKGTALHLFVQLCNPERVMTVDGARQELLELVDKGCITPGQSKVIRPEKVTRFFNSSLGKLAVAKGMHREFKFSMLSDANKYFGDAGSGEQVLLQGVVDLWFSTPEGIVVVDFKTDYITPGGEEEKARQYQMQMDVYTSALQEITGQKVAHRYLWFFRTDTAWEV